MPKKIVWRMVLILAIVGFFLFMIYPPQEKIKLGLDLKGGSHLVLQVNTDDALENEVDQAREWLVDSLIDESIPFTEVVRKEDRTLEILAEAPQEEAIKEVLDDRMRDWDYTLYRGRPNRWVLHLKEYAIREIEERTVRQSLNTLRNRVDQFGVEEPTIQRQGLGGNRIVLELPGLDDPERVKEKIKTVAQLEWKEVVSGPYPSQEEAMRQLQGSIPEAAELLPVVGDTPFGEGTTPYILLKKAAVVAGKDLKNAFRSVDENNLPAVSFSLNAEGSRKFSRYTAEHIGDLLAIVLDDKVHSYPVIRTRIPGDGQISGGFTTVQEAEDLALLLKSGALPASMTYLEERSVGPSLGRDSIRLGIYAAFIGLLLVIVFMITYYKKSGINAVVALLLNIIIVLGVLAYFGAALTLPGIAGFILTIGMAVDANVLIFERIREEMREGKSVRTAVSSGFRKAWRTILDANLTTLIAALFLLQFGTGPVKGFAITLSVGVIASMFTAVFVSRTIFEATLFRRGPRVEKLSI